ncbi:hypothetical protein [Qipengyuania sp.]|uniref:hypothetical protein n=1 Tax=Qipengyuania sp. TaxID=2004515 RepID=UPI0035C8264B
MQIQTSQVTSISSFVSGQGPQRESAGDEAGFTSALASLVSESEPGEKEHSGKNALGESPLSDAEEFIDPQFECGFDAVAFGSLKLPPFHPSAPAAVLFENPTGKALPVTGKNLPLYAIGQEQTTLNPAASLGLTVSPALVPVPIRAGTEEASVPVLRASLATLDLKGSGLSKPFVNALDGSVSIAEPQNNELRVRISPIPKEPGPRIADSSPLLNAGGAASIHHDSALHPLSGTAAVGPQTSKVDVASQHPPTSAGPVPGIPIEATAVAPQTPKANVTSEQLPTSTGIVSAAPEAAAAVASRTSNAGVASLSIDASPNMLSEAVVSSAAVAPGISNPGTTSRHLNGNIAISADALAVSEPFEISGSSIQGDDRTTDIELSPANLLKDPPAHRSKEAALALTANDSMSKSQTDSGTVAFADFASRSQPADVAGAPQRNSINSTVGADLARQIAEVTRDLMQPLENTGSQKGEIKLNHELFGAVALRMSRDNVAGLEVRVEGSPELHTALAAAHRDDRSDARQPNTQAHSSHANQQMASSGSGENTYSSRKENEPRFRLDEQSNEAGQRSPGDGSEGSEGRPLARRRGVFA